MSLDESSTERRGAPVRALALGVAMTVALLVLGGSLAWGLYAKGKQLLTTDLRLRTLIGEILRIDELLTMSARMAAATGQPQWEARYRRHEPIIEAHIAEAMMIAPRAVAHSMVAAQAEGEKLVDIEHRALALIAAGRRDEAAALLGGPEYDGIKDRYAAAVAAIVRAMTERGETAFAEQQLQFRVVVGVALVILCVLGFAWKRIITRMLRQRGASARQLALAAANRELDARVKARTVELSETNARLEHSLEKLAATQRELMSASRKAGMAMVASGVLHNVGNVLNSVNVSSATAAEVIRRIRLDGLGMVSALLRGGDPAKVRRVPEYLDKVALHLAEDHAAVLAELVSLQKNIDHIKVVIAKQQANARSMAVLELFNVAELVEDAMQFESGSDAREGLQLICELAEELPIVLADRHKLTQMVVNLLANARHAVRNHDGAAKTIWVRTRAVPGERFAIEVEDTGYGITPENLARIFEHGFTTKKDGHGFGLHASACDVQEMGGALRVHSDGAGRGARFTIELPIAPREERLHTRSLTAPRIVA